MSFPYSAVYMHRRQIGQLLIGALPLAIAGCANNGNGDTPTQTTKSPTTTSSPETGSPTATLTNSPTETPTPTTTVGSAENVHQIGDRFIGPLDALGWKATAPGRTDSVGGASAAGMFVVVTLDATETSGQTVTVTSEVIRLEDAAGSRYAVDEDGMNAVDDPFEFGDIYPGTGSSGDLVFDVPNDASGLRLRIGESDIHYVDLGLADT
jgi:hypothetical protein